MDAATGAAAAVAVFVESPSSLQVLKRLLSLLVWKGLCPTKKSTQRLQDRWPLAGLEFVAQRGRRRKKCNSFSAVKEFRLATRGFLQL